MTGQQVAKLEGEKVKNPYQSAEVVKADNESGMIASEAQRAMIEVMTQFEVAKRFPRDPMICSDRILKECSRPTLAELATYSYPKGGQEISGPTIRLMEAIARAWGNVRFGWKVIDANQQRSIIRAFAFDLETNVDRSTEFEVRHWRDTKSGGYPIKDEREVYELCANKAMRRVRSCIEGLIPRDVIDMALEKCEETSRMNIDTSPEGLKKLLEAFSGYDVNQAMIEQRYGGLKMESMKAPQIVGLRKIFASLKDGIARVEDFFDVSLADKKEDKKGGGQPDLKKEVEAKKAEESDNKNQQAKPQTAAPKETPTAENPKPGDKKQDQKPGPGKLV